MGICPQHDVLWEYVTPREHLRAFAFLRGVKPGEVEATVVALLERLDLLVCYPSLPPPPPTSTELLLALVCLSQVSVLMLCRPLASVHLPSLRPRRMSRRAPSAAA